MNGGAINRIAILSLMPMQIAWDVLFRHLNANRHDEFDTTFNRVVNFVCTQMRKLRIWGNNELSHTLPSEKKKKTVGRILPPLKDRHQASAREYSPISLRSRIQRAVTFASFVSLRSYSMSIASSISTTSW